MRKARIFFDIEKEVAWLNAMSKNGFRLTDKQGFTYIFETDSENQYLYQVEKMSFSSNKKIQGYLDFLEEMDIKPVAKQMGWIYLEKKNDDRPFEIYTDIPSKIKQYKAIISTYLITTLLCISFIINIINKPAGAQGPYIFNFSIPLILNPLIILVLFYDFIKYFFRIRTLKRDDSTIE